MGIREAAYAATDAFWVLVPVVGALMWLVWHFEKTGAAQVTIPLRRLKVVALGIVPAAGFSAAFLAVAFMGTGATPLMIALFVLGTILIWAFGALDTLLQGEQARTPAQKAMRAGRMLVAGAIFIAPFVLMRFA